MMMRRFYLSATCVVAVFLQAFCATPSEIQIVTADCETGEFSLRLPAAERELALYSVVAKGSDSLAELSQWRNPHFVQTVPAGTTDLSVTIPPIENDESYRFILADPELATVSRVSYLIGGKDANGKFNSAFLTGLHPNWDWRYEIVFSVSEFGTGQSWLLCHRDSNMSKNSVICLAVRGVNGQANDRKLRFGHGSTGDKTTSGSISEGVVYQASIDGRKCVYTNLTTGFEFEQVETASYVTDYGFYSLCFGAAVNGNDFAAGDGCSFAQVYSFKAWDGSGELVADYRPIVKNSVAGYFDVVTRKFFKSGDGFDSDVFTPYVASTETLPADTLVEHLGEPVAVSSEGVLCMSESLPFSVDGLPVYGRSDVAKGSSVTFELPSGEFLWTDAAEGSRYRVRAAGLRIDTCDAQTGAWVKGVPHYNLMSYTYTRKEEDDEARIVFLWDAEMLVDAPDGRRADCLRLVSVGKGADGKTEVGHGLFDTGVHPIPATTRVLMDVSFDTDSSSYNNQNTASPCDARRFFGVRDSADHGSGKPEFQFQYNFQLSRVGAARLRVDFCNYLDGIQQSSGPILDVESGVRYQIDVNPTYVRFSEGKSGAWNSRLAEIVNSQVTRSPEPLAGKIYIFGSSRGDDAKAPLCVDYDNTRYYSLSIWQDGVTLTHDYVPCLNAADRPAFYDRVSGEYLYPIGDKAVYEAEFGADADIGSVCVTGETADGEPASYVDPDGTMPGDYSLAVGESKTFTATSRKVFGLRVVGYRIDTWEDGVGWVKGKEQKGTSVTLQREESVRRLVWIWKGQKCGLVIFLR